MFWLTPVKCKAYFFNQPLQDPNQPWKVTQLDRQIESPKLNISADIFTRLN